MSQVEGRRVLIGRLGSWDLGLGSWEFAFWMSAVAACSCSGSQAVAAWGCDLDTGRPTGCSDCASDLVACTPPCGDAPAAAEPASEVEKTVQWGTGLPNPSPAVIRRLCASLDPSQADDIMKCPKACLSQPPPQRSRTSKNGFEPKRSYRSPFQMP